MLAPRYTVKLHQTKRISTNEGIHRLPDPETSYSIVGSKQVVLQRLLGPSAKKGYARRRESLQATECV